MKTITLFDTLNVSFKKKQVVLDGKKYKTKNGAWAYYVPKLQAKWFYSHDQKIICLHKTAPKSLSSIEENKDYGTYSADDWRSALSQCIFTKAATNYVIIKKLYQFGLGPEPLGFSVAKFVNDDLGLINGPAVGVNVANIKKLRTKPDATIDDLTKAGIISDKINSAIRQQIKGYVSDLNSVVSVSLMEHDDAIKDLAEMLRASFKM